jgi:hypothetical protein
MKELIISPPSSKQEEFFESHKRFIGYGGARGGGKSWALRTKFTTRKYLKKWAYFVLMCSLML